MEEGVEECDMAWRIIGWARRAGSWMAEDKSPQRQRRRETMEVYARRQQRGPQTAMAVTRGGKEGKTAARMAATEARQR
jgi:hypothetical protein